MTRTSREMLCGISYADLVGCAGMSQKEAAKRLGVNYNYFNQVVKRNGCGHWFPKPKQTFTRCVSRDDIAQVAAEGYIMKDAAFILGISADYLGLLVSEWGLRHLFPNCGKAAAISRKGYCT